MGTEVKSTVAANNSNGSAPSTPAARGENIQEQPSYYWDHLYGGLSKKFCDFVCRIRKFAYLCSAKPSWIHDYKVHISKLLKFVWAQSCSTSTSCSRDGLAKQERLRPFFTYILKTNF